MLLQANNVQTHPSNAHNRTKLREPPRQSNNRTATTQSNHSVLLFNCQNLNCKRITLICKCGIYDVFLSDFVSP